MNLWGAYWKLEHVMSKRRFVAPFNAVGVIAMWRHPQGAQRPPGTFSSTDTISLQAPRLRLRSASPDLKLRQPSRLDHGLQTPATWAPSAQEAEFPRQQQQAKQVRSWLFFLFLTGFEGLRARRQSHKRTRRLLRGGRRIKIVMSEGATESAPYPDVLCVVATNRAA